MDSENEIRAKVAAVGCVIVLGVIAVVLWVFFTPPGEAIDANRRLDPSDNPNPSDRINAIQVILRLALDGERMSGWQQIQEKGCRDPDSQVRVAALQALGKFTKQRPNEVVKTFGAKVVYVDTRFLNKLGRSDPSPAVRLAAAEYWADADILWEEGIAALTEMLAAEKDERVLEAARGALARRVQVSREAGHLDEKEAGALQQRHNLPPSKPAHADAKPNPVLEAPKGGEKAEGQPGFLTRNPWRMRSFGMFACVALGLVFRRIKQGADAQTPERQQAGCVLVGVVILAFVGLAVWTVVVDGWLATAGSIGIAIVGGFLVFLFAFMGQQE